MKKIFLMVMVLVLSLGISCSGGGGGGNAVYYTVTWNLNYEGAPSPEAERAEAGTFLTEPSEPEREGFIFTGWYKEAACDNLWNFTADVITGNTELYAGWEEAADGCITFKSSSPFSISVDIPGWKGTVYYSADKEQWTEWAGTIADAVQASDSNYYLYFRGKGNSVITGSYAYKWKLTGTGIECRGNIMTLLDYEDPDNAGMASSCYSCMFNGCTGLTSAPALPATQLAMYCYAYMFCGCSSLKISRSPGTVFFTCPESYGGASSNSVEGMFISTGGSYTSNPVPGGAYYYE